MLQNGQVKEMCIFTLLSFLASLTLLATTEHMINSPNKEALSCTGMDRWMDGSYESFKSLPVDFHSMLVLTGSNGSTLGNLKLCFGKLSTVYF